MKSITKLKDEARKHEQKEEWEKAIKVYLQVLDAGEDESGEVELPLFNRVGDLYVRLGRPKDAVQYYEQAADRYAEAGLYNNAIALCNKALRYAPGNMELLRKLGQFSAQQGFLTDARRYYLEYAQKKIDGGEIDAALRALASFADVSEDAEVRELLGRKLHVHGRASDAVHELKRAYDMRVEAGETAAAAALRAEIEAIDPRAFPAEPEPAFSPPPRAAETAPPVIPQAPDLTLTPAPVESAGVDLGGDEDEDFHIRLPELDTAEAEAVADAAPLEGLESTVFEGFGEAAADAGLLPGLEPASEFEAPAEPETVEVTGLDRPVLDEPPDVPHLDTSGFEDSIGGWSDDDVAFDLPVLETDYAADEADGRFDLPLLDGGAGEEAEPADSLPVIEPLPSLEDAIAELEAEGALPDLPELPEEEPPAAALEPLPELPEPEPVEPEPLPELPGPEPLEPEPLEPEPESEPEPVEAEPEPEPAGWDPTQLGAPAAPQPAAVRTPPAARQPLPPSDDFIDLGALLSEDEEKAEDTRFVVQEKPPTGDEDQDFAELLSQFKQKLAEHVSAEDAAAHYDLGLAFKEMGLIDEAIGEFQVSLRAGDMRLKVYEELGQCFLLKEQYNIAEKVLRRALESKYQDELELLGVYYHLGRAYEAMEKREQARDAYERVLGLDINFADVTARLARL